MSYSPYHMISSSLFVSSIMLWQTHLHMACPENSDLRPSSHLCKTPSEPGGRVSSDVGALRNISDLQQCLTAVPRGGLAPLVRAIFLLVG